MPKVDLNNVYVGIDPGTKGGIAVLHFGKVTLCKLENATVGDVWEFLSALPTPRVFAVVEQQVPRPTSFLNRKTGQWTASILKSTCLLYGFYRELLGLLMASGISHEPVTPQKWQKGLGMVPKKKGEKDTSWKNRLKAKAQQLFPKAKVTLAVADAILLAEYCRRKVEGKL